MDEVSDEYFHMPGKHRRTYILVDPDRLTALEAVAAAAMRLERDLRLGIPHYDNARRVRAALDRLDAQEPSQAVTGAKETT